MLSYALQITTATSICVRLASITENSFNAVERVGEYSELASEPRGPPEVDPPEDWPSSGEVLMLLSAPADMLQLHALLGGALVQLSEAPANAIQSLLCNDWLPEKGLTGCMLLH